MPLGKAIVISLFIIYINVSVILICFVCALSFLPYVFIIQCFIKEIIRFIDCIYFKFSFVL